MVQNGQKLPLRKLQNLPPARVQLQVHVQATPMDHAMDSFPKQLQNTSVNPKLPKPPEIDHFGGYIYLLYSFGKITYN